VKGGTLSFPIPKSKMGDLKSERLDGAARKMREKYTKQRTTVKGSASQSETDHREIVRARVRKLKKSMGTTSQEFWEKLDLPSGTVNSWLTGGPTGRSPDKFACLLLAGISSRTDDKSFFLAASGLTEAQRPLIANALGWKRSAD